MYPTSEPVEKLLSHKSCISILGISCGETGWLQVSRKIVRPPLFLISAWSPILVGDKVGDEPVEVVLHIDREYSLIPSGNSVKSSVRLFNFHYTLRKYKIIET